MFLFVTDGPGCGIVHHKSVQEVRRWMDDNNKNEMEQIQRGLEAFLEKEIDGAGNPGSGRRETGPPESPEVLEFPDARREPQDVRIIEGPWSGGRSRRERESREDEDLSLIHI